MSNRKTSSALIIAFVLFAVHPPGAWGGKLSDASLFPQKGTVGKPFRFQLNGKIHAGIAPYNHVIQSGQLPPGLTVSKRGLIIGRPTTAGEFKYWVDTFDENDPVHSRHSQRLLTITIEPAHGETFAAADWEKPGWTLTYGDEFNGRNLDDDRKLDDVHWVTAYQGTMPANFAVENDLLHVRIDRDTPAPQVMPPSRPDKLGRASSVETQWKFMQQYGLFEVRARAPRGPGVMSAIWLSPALAYEKLESDGGKRKSADEPIDVDVMKHFGNDPRTAVFAAHYGRTLGEQTDGKRMVMPSDPSDEFHVYALEWNEKALVWYVDGKEVHRSDKVPHTPMFVRLSVFEDEAYGKLDGSVAYPRDLVVDYVRVYERVSEAEAANP